MKARTIAAFAILLVGTIGALPAHALDETCSIDGGSAATPHVEDIRDDGLTGGNGTGDVVADPTDVIDGWFARTADGVVTVNFRVAQLTGAETNNVYYFRWSFAGNDPAHADRFIRVQPAPYGGQFRYGYYDGAAGSYTSVGSTTGTATAGTPGTISAVVPLNKLGAPNPGDLLEGVSVEAHARAGAPPLPPGSPGLPASPPAYVFLMDDTSNGGGCDSVTA